MADKQELRQKVASLFELPGDVVLDVARVTLVGDMELLVENHRGLTEYTRERVVLKLPQGSAQIVGQELEIGSISPDGIAILGKIREIKYLE